MDRWPVVFIDCGLHEDGVSRRSIPLRARGAGLPSISSTDLAALVTSAWARFTEGLLWHIFDLKYEVTSAWARFTKGLLWHLFELRCEQATYLQWFEPED